MISQKLCEYDHSFKITFQYCLWDFLRECGENDIGGLELVKNVPSTTTVEKVPLRRIVNLSKLYALLLTGGQLSVIILKVSFILSYIFLFSLTLVKLTLTAPFWDLFSRN